MYVITKENKGSPGRTERRIISSKGIYTDSCKIVRVFTYGFIRFLYIYVKAYKKHRKVNRLWVFNYGFIRVLYIYVLKSV